MAGASAGALERGRRRQVPTQPGLLMAGTDRRRSSRWTGWSAAYDRDERARSGSCCRAAAGTSSFSDLCEVGAADGGLLAIAELLGVPVPDAAHAAGNRRLRAPALPPTEAWPAIRQTMVAYLRHEFGFDRSAGARAA